MGGREEKKMRKAEMGVRGERNRERGRWRWGHGKDKERVVELGEGQSRREAGMEAMESLGWGGTIEWDGGGNGGHMKDRERGR